MKSSSMRKMICRLSLLPQLLLPTIVLLTLLPSEKTCCAAVPTSPSDYPTKITLRAGILHAPPFAYVTEQDDGSYEYTGFQPDLLRQMTVFAQKDNVELEILMSPSPPQYNAAFDRVASDCNTTANPLSEEECNEFDMMAANYYATASRSLRAQLSPPLLRSTISTIKYVDKSPGTMDFTTLRQVETAGATVCLKDGTFYAGLVKAKYPNANFLMCPNQEACLAALKAEECVLSADDELQIRFKVAWDDTLDVTPESFNTQYIVWALKEDLPPLTLRLFEKWMYDANTNATNDDLYSKYFQKALCPVGTAGESCELPCDPNHGEADSRGVCVCISTKYTGSDCSIEVPENVNLIPSGLKITAYVMVGINVVTIVACAIWLAWKRNCPQVRVSQPSFLLLVLVGCLISSSTILVLAQEDEGDGPVPACMAIPWLYSFGFSVTFGTLFAKIRRVYILFKTSGDSTSTRPTIISVQETLGVIGAVLFIDVTILIVWTVLDPLQWEREIISTDQFGSPLESEGTCYSNHWAFFAGCIALLHLVLMGVACSLCYVARDIPTRFQEGKYVSIAMISNLQIFVVGVPILIIIGTEPTTSFFVRSVIIWMNDFVVVTLIFGNLIYQVHFDPNRKDSEEAIKSSVDKTVHRFSIQGALPREKSRASVSFQLGAESGAGLNGIGEEEEDDDDSVREHDIDDDGTKENGNGGEDRIVSRISATGQIEKFRQVGPPAQAQEQAPPTTTATTMGYSAEEEKNGNGTTVTTPTCQKPVDVLKDNKGSWALGTVSQFMRDDIE